MSARDESLDALRGLTVFGMGFVNLQGAPQHSFAPFVHAEWHGLTAADLVFPFFLLVVGLAIPLAVDRTVGAPRWSRIWRRALLLTAIGIALNWLIRPSALDDLRLTGVLQRIGVVYLACAALALLRPGWRLAALTAAALLVLHALTLIFVGAPGGIAPGIEPGQGISGWLDRVALPGRALRGTYDPEGVLSTLSAVASGLIGVATMRWLHSRSARSPSNMQIANVGAAVFALGVAVITVLPANKPLWTPSFALVTAGFGLLTWALLRSLWAGIGGSTPARGAVLLGQTALTLYVVQLLLIAVLVRKLPSGERIWDAGYSALAASGLAPAWASLLFALLGSALCVALMPPLKRRGWLLRA